MAVYSDLWAQEYRKILKEAITGLMDNLASGSCVSFDNYKFICGRIQAYRDALEFMEHAHTEANKKLEGK